MISGYSVKKKNMQNRLLAARYAKSLYGVAEETGQLAAVEKDVQYLKAVCQTSADFVLFLCDPRLRKEEKHRVLDALFTGKLMDLTRLFLRLLIQKRREKYLPEITEVFEEKRAARTGILQAKLTTAIPVSEETKNLFVGKLQAATGRASVRLVCVVEDRVIGGFILEYDGKLVDASLQKGIRRLKDRFDKARPVVKAMELKDLSGLPGV
jgi:F-type H+-transporting ATPase subunit delta